MYLSFSGFERADSCQFDFWHVYYNKTDTGVLDDRLGSIYGQSTGIVFEKFYKDQLWRQPNTKDVMVAMVPDIVDQTLKEAYVPYKGRPGGTILWRGEEEGQNPNGMYFDQDELTRDVIAAVGRGLKTIKENLFVSRRAIAEHKLDSKVEQHYLAGRADFTMTRPKHKDTIIIDGKGTQHTKVDKETGIRHGKYLHDEQLIWYSLLYREHYKRLPDQAAFLFWRYEPPTNVTWVEINETVVDTLKNRVLSLADELLKKRTILYGDTLTEDQLARGLATPRVSLELAQEHFVPKANQQNCQFCPFSTEDLCPTGYKVMKPIRERWANREV